MLTISVIIRRNHEYFKIASLALGKKKNENIGNSHNCGAYLAHQEYVLIKIEMTNRKTISHFIEVFEFFNTSNFHFFNMHNTLKKHNTTAPLNKTPNPLALASGSWNAPRSLLENVNGILNSVGFVFTYWCENTDLIKFTNDGWLWKFAGVS